LAIFIIRGERLITNNNKDGKRNGRYYDKKGIVLAGSGGKATPPGSIGKPYEKGSCNLSYVAFYESWAGKSMDFT